MRNSDISNFDDVMEALAIFFADHQYRASRDKANILVKDNNGNGTFVIRAITPTKIVICADEDVVDVANPTSFDTILNTIKHCKATAGQDIERCATCPIVKVRSCRITVPTD